MQLLSGHKATRAALPLAFLFLGGALGLANCAGASSSPGGSPAALAVPVGLWAVDPTLVDEVVPRARATPDRFEIQMLFGVPRDALLAELTARGVRARLYVPFANGWDMAIQYLRRRLDEYPAMMWMVAKNLVWRS